MDEFLSAFDNADVLLVADVYAAGEKPIEGVNKEAFIKKLNHPNALTISSSDDMNEKIASIASSGDLVIGLGAGDVSKWVTDLPQHLKERKK
jgi:UDP-N-acetylmuramate--alanine ligase